MGAKLLDVACPLHLPAIRGQGVGDIRRSYPAFCPSWGHRTDILFRESPYGVPDDVLAWAAARATPSGRVLLYSAGGVHTGLSAQSVATHFDAPYAKMRALVNDTEQVVALVHAPGKNFDGNAMYRSQGTGPRALYNAMARGLAAPRRVVFDAWTPTHNCTSFDDMHYDQAVNVVLAQLLLNLLDAMAWSA